MQESRLNKKLKIVLYLMVLLVFVYGNYKAFHNIYEKQTSEYVLKTQKTIPVTLSENINGSFQPVAQHLTYICIPVVLGQHTDNITIIIFDDNSSKIYEQLLTENELKSDLNQIILDVSNITFEPQQLYQIEILPNPSSDLQIICNDDKQIQIRQVYPFQHKKLLVFTILLIDILLCIAMLIYYRQKTSNTFFVAFSLITGVIVSVILTPCSMNDEYRHFLRVYDIAQGNVCTELTDYSQDINGNVIKWVGGKNPVAIVPEWVNNLKYIDVSENYLNISYEAEVNQKTNIDKLLQLFNTSNDNTKTYMTSIEATWEISALAYLPQLIFVIAGKLFGIDNLILYYLARLGNVVACSILFYFTLKNGEKYKHIICLIYFMPSIILFRSSCVTDGLLFSLILLTVTIIIKIKNEHYNIFTPKNLIPLFLLTAYIAVIKLPYALVIFVLLILDKGNYKIVDSKGRYVTFKIFLPVVMIIAAFIFYRITDYLSGFKVYNEINAAGKSLVGGEHITYIFHHPVAISIMFIKSFWNTLCGYPVAIKGLYSVLYGEAYLFYSLLFLLLYKKILSIKEKAYVITVLIIITLSVLFVGYTWQRADLGYIWGVGYKYYIPIMPLLFYVLPVGNQRTQAVIDNTMPIFLIIGNYIYLIELLRAFIL